MTKQSKSISTTNSLFGKQESSLKKRLSEITLTEQEINSLKKEKTKEIITDKVLGSFQIGKIIQTILNWNEDVNSEVKKKKEEILLSNFLIKVDQNEVRLDEITNLLSNPYGFSLVGKIFNILYDSPPDDNLIGHLSNLLKNISKSDFELLFNQHKHIINMIEKLSPQSLSILMDNENWPDIPKGTGPRRISMGRITTPWTKHFAKAYMEKNNINSSDSSMINMIDYSVFSLLSNNLIEGKSDNDGTRIVITEIGSELLEYLE